MFLYVGMWEALSSCVSFMNIHHSCLFALCTSWASLLYLWLWCSTLELAFSTNSPSSASHWKKHGTRSMTVEYTKCRIASCAQRHTFSALSLASLGGEISILWHSYKPLPPLMTTHLWVNTKVTFSASLTRESWSTGPPALSYETRLLTPVAGSIGVRFLDRTWDDFRDIDDYLHLECIDVTLHEPSPANVSPITVRRHTPSSPD
ncbi:hypothetical protein HD554DRAFT_2143034 [Boletus coccyginus]|nr:hypothetical protein HD554DRAFT_2143034 [Boletus coccyginus]